MPRVKGGPASRRRRRKIMKLAKGYVGGRRRLYRAARETVERGLAYAYRDRRVRKRVFRGLWNIRIGAGARVNGLSYSRLIHGLKLAGVALDRKILADLAATDAHVFDQLAQRARHALDAGRGALLDTDRAVAPDSREPEPEPEAAAEAAADADMGESPEA